MSSLQHRHRVLESFNKKNIEIFVCMCVCFLYVHGSVEAKINVSILILLFWVLGSRGLAASDHI